MIDKWDNYFYALPEEFKEHFKKMNKLNKYMINFLDNDDSIEIVESNFQILINFIKNNNFQNDFHDLTTLIHFLSILTQKIFYANNKYFEKIQRILIFFKKEICLQIPVDKLYKYFKKSNHMILFLYQNGFLDIFDSKLIDKIFTRERVEMIEFFYPEIRKKILDADDEEKNKEVYSNIIKLVNLPFLQFLKKYVDESFEEKRQRGVNDDILAQIIKNDRYEEFIKYNEMNGLNLNASVSHSIFEGNIMLSKSHLSFIEYSAFYGSIQIFKYLYTNKAELSSFLYTCAIHGRNYEIIHILEEEKNLQIDFDRCLQNSIKLHYYDFADYFLGNHLNGVMSDESFTKCFNSFNFQFIKPDKNSNKNKSIDDLDDFKSFLNNLFKICCTNDYYHFANILSHITQPVQINVNMKIDIFFYFFFIIVQFNFFWLIWHFISYSYKTLLHAAVKKELIEIIKLLLNIPSIRLDEPDNIFIYSYFIVFIFFIFNIIFLNLYFYQTPFKDSISYGNMEIINLFITNPNIDINLQDNILNQFYSLFLFLKYLSGIN